MGGRPFIKNMVGIKEHYKKYYQKNKDKYKERYRKNRIEFIKYSTKWKKEHPEKVKVNRRKHDQIYRLNPKFRVDHNLSRHIEKALERKKAGRKWEKLVGYTLEDLIKHLESKFDNKMTWENYGSYWDIDHIKPKSLFHYKNPEDPEFKKCWALENLQPLEHTANMKKWKKYPTVESK